MAMKPDIKAGSSLAAALAQHSNATAHTMLANSEMLGRNLNHIFDRMERNRVLKAQEEQRQLDNAYRENAFNEQKATNERNYNFEREKYNNAKQQWAQEFALKKEALNYDNALKKTQLDYFKNFRGKGETSVDALFLPDENMDYAKEQTPQPQQQMLFLSREEADKARQAQPTQTTPQHPAPQSYLSAQYAINQRNAQPQPPQEKQDSALNRIPFFAISSVKVQKPEITMQSNNPKDKAMEAELSKRLQERKAYLQTLRNER